MKHPSYHATITPDKIAYEMAGSGASLTFGELEDASNQGAQALRSLGIQAGDHIAYFLENRLEFLTLSWAAQRSGIIFTPISRYLTAAEAAFILSDSGSKIFISSAKYGETAKQIRDLVGGDIGYWMLDDPENGFSSWDNLTNSMLCTKISDQRAGASMLYSSGTTGRPKGIVRHYPNQTIDSLSPVVLPVCEDLAGMTKNSIYLSPAPLYHSAPLAAAMVAGGLGVTTIVMESFDEERFLDNVQKHKITHTQVVPTMFVRLLKMPQDIRESFDISTLEGAIHIAAPCPEIIKRQMIDWWGPILVEYYGGTEGNGVTALTTKEWLAHPGSVGKALFGAVRILDEAGAELPRRSIGNVYFDTGLLFEYRGDTDKTQAAFTPEGWSTLGDIGWMDEDGYLYLTDRRAYTIITGGVNVYPQETEDLLITHPAVADVAVFGVPNSDLGEEVKAVVQLAIDVKQSPDLKAELIEFCRAHLSAIKAPKSIDFRADMPRTETGKLIKRHLKDEYWP